MLKKAARVAGNALIIAGLTIALAEVVFRVWPPAGLTEDVLTRGGNPRQLLIEPHPYMSYVLTRGLDRPSLHHNALGFRGPEVQRDKPDGVTRILCLGDSATYGFTVSSDENAWPERLRAVLQAGARNGEKYEVINAAAPGYTSFESLTMLQFRGLDLRPDVVIVYLGFNDLRASTWPEVQPDNTHFRKSWSLPQDRTVAVLELSRTFLLARWFFTDYRNQATELARYVIVPEDGDQLTHGQSRANDTGVANFRRNLRSIVAVARAHGAQVLLATQAYGEATISASHANVVGDAMTRLAMSVRQVARERESDRGVALLDARRILPAVPGMFADGVHVNDAGSDRLARIVAARLVELGWTVPVVSGKESI